MKKVSIALLALLLLFTQFACSAPQTVNPTTAPQTPAPAAATPARYRNARCSDAGA